MSTSEKLRRSVENLRQRPLRAESGVRIKPSSDTRYSEKLIKRQLTALKGNLCWYSTMIKNGAPGAIRTPDPLIRSQVLYPAELRVHCVGGLVAAHRQCKPRSYAKTPTGKKLSNRPVTLGQSDPKFGPFTIAANQSDVATVPAYQLRSDCQSQPSSTFAYRTFKR